MRGDRSRWKVENETFNTLKNQGYNYGHGNNNLLTIVAMLMILVAFMIEQIQQHSCPLFNMAFKKAGAKYSL